MARLLLVVCLALFASVALAGLDPNNAPLIWELTDGEDKGIGGGFDVVDDLKMAPWLFKYTYDQGKTVSIGNTLFALPDGIAATSVHKYIGFNETRIANTWNDYFEQTLKTTSITASINYNNLTLNAAFSSSKGYINHLTENGTKNFGFNGGIYLTFQLQFRGTRFPAFDDDFAWDMKNLPQTYDAVAYGRFLRAWGTHFFTRASYGCMYNLTAALDKKFFEQNQAKWASSQLDLTIKYNMFEFGVKDNRQVNKTEIDGKIADNVKVTANAHGGDELKFVADKDYSGWLESCRTMKAPIVAYSDVEPITNLITDAVVKNNLKQAIVQYGTTGKYPGM